MSISGGCEGGVGCFVRAGVQDQVALYHFTALCLAGLVCAGVG